MTRRLILEGWNSYRTQVLAGAGPIQVEECRKAFYSGSLILFNSIMEAMEAGTEATDADMRQMAAINDELLEYAEQLKRRAGI